MVAQRLRGGFGGCVSHRRELCVLGLGVVVALAFCATASANIHGGRVVNDHCVGSACTIRSIRAKISHISTWSPPSGEFGTVWVGGQDGNSSQVTGPELVQAGLMKADPGSLAGQNCIGGTAGSVKEFAEWISSSNSLLDCVIGPEVTTGSGLSFKVERCPGNAWCAFANASSLGPAAGFDIGIANAKWVEAIGEYSCGPSCVQSGDDILGQMGGTDVSNKFSVSECSTTTCTSPYYSVQASDAPKFDDTCGGGLNSDSGNWGFDPVNPSTPWDIFSITPMSC
jgi:hypothetical protein